MNTTLPPTIATVPCSGACTLTSVSGSPSASVSLPSSEATLSVTGVSSGVLCVSATATGGSFTGVTFRRSVFGVGSNAPALSCTLKVKVA